MKKSNKETKQVKGLKRDVRELHRDEMQQILRQTELPIIERFSDNYLDRENEKFLLLSGTETSWKELKEAHIKFKKFINSKLREWEFTFPESLYRQWRRLKGWDVNSKTRPMIFAAYTVRDIYGSLPREIYAAMEEINEYIYPGIRMYKYCQLLTKECHEEVRSIIAKATEFAENSNDLYEYRLKLAAKYGTPFSKTVFQMDAFRDNDGILGTI